MRLLARNALRVRQRQKQLRDAALSLHTPLRSAQDALDEAEERAYEEALEIRRRVLQQAAALGLSTRRVDVPAEWRELVARAAQTRVHEHEGHARGDAVAGVRLTHAA